MPDYINIRTAQNVEISYKLAGLGNRILAKFLDLLIMSGYLIAMGFALDSVEFMGWGVFIFFLPIFLYTLLFEVFNNGQTPGKSVLRMKVVSLDGTPLSLGQILTRWLLQLVDIWIMSGLAGLLSVVSGSKQQRLGDMAAGTIVVSLKQDSSLEKTAFVKVEEDYQPVYTQASQLSEQDVRIIKTVLTDKSDNSFAIMSKAAAKIEGIIDVKKNVSSQEFLKTIIKDYNYYQNDGTSESDYLNY